jgi:hypothetical protein
MQVMAMISLPSMLKGPALQSIWVLAMIAFAPMDHLAH